ncbi:hypothetical protein [Weizmannia phage Youna2]
MPKFTSIDSLKQARASQTYEGVLEARLNNKPIEVPKKVINGEMEVFELTKPIGEMLTSDQGAEELLKKVVLDVELGREEVPLLYKSIYRTIADRSLPKIIDATFAQRGVVYFTEWREGEEIKFGALEAESGPTARLTTYAAGFEYTEDMEEYNEAFSMQMLNQAFGEAYNALLNHIHLSPIITHTYPSENVTELTTEEASAITGEYAKERQTQAVLRKAIQASRQAGRNGSILLANSADQFQIEDAFKSYTVGATPYEPVSGIDEVIFYDGWEVTVGKKTYRYDGVPQGKAFLVRPKKGFIEFEKHGLIVDAALSDLSRLVEAQIVARTRRGVYAAVEDNVQQINLP